MTSNCWQIYTQFRSWLQEHVTLKNLHFMVLFVNTTSGKISNNSSACSFFLTKLSESSLLCYLSVKKKIEKVFFCNVSFDWPWIKLLNQLPLFCKQNNGKTMKWISVLSIHTCMHAYYFYEFQSKECVSSPSITDQQSLNVKRSYF